MNKTEDFYVKNKYNLLKTLTGSILLDHVPRVLESSYSVSVMEETIKETNKKFYSYLKTLPYSGEEDLHDTQDMAFAAWCLAFYRTMKEQGYTAKEAGKVLYNAAVNKMNTYPKFLLAFAGKLIFTKIFKWKYRKQQEATPRKKCKYCFKSNYVEGDGRSFDYGKDFVQCGINTFFKEQGAKEFMPYMCCLDYPLAEPLKIGFHRTTTLGIGGDRCDFRYKKGKATETGWPPKGT
jgi:hypothetical protein